MGSIVNNPLRWTWIQQDVSLDYTHVNLFISSEILLNVCF